jgi:DNA-binding transcriptional MocR family regulator
MHVGRWNNNTHENRKAPATDYHSHRAGRRYFLWIECAPSVNSLEVHRRALSVGISLAPGPIFSARQQFGNFIRINYGHPWTAAMDQAVQRIGEILRRY